MTDRQLKFMHPYFMGAYAENAWIFENLLLEFVRDHAYWRRNFHPENRPPIPRTANYREDFNEFLAEMQQELQTLSADLKKSVPFFSPRYMGHMAADLLIPGVLAQFMTTLYNPNNVSDDAAPATLEKELEVGFMLARLFGFNTDPDAEPHAWGHLTSGGTVANYEGLWNLRAVKFYPISLAEAARQLKLDVEEIGPKQQNLSEYTQWELFNFSIRETVELMRGALRQLQERVSRAEFQEFTKLTLAESVAHLGMADFFLKHRDLKPPRVIVPTSAHYSWEKACKVLGIGAGQLSFVRTDGHMRMDAGHLEETLERCWQKRQPVLGVIGVLGSTEFGSVDPIHKIVDLRDSYKRDKGFFFGIHVDGAWGGYMTSIFREKDGGFISHEKACESFKYFPHEGTWNAFRAVAQVDSVTIDPHKLGYLPFPCGAFVSRDAGTLDFICQKAAYVFDVKEDPFRKPAKQKLLGLGQYIMEGSKPGSAAAAAYITHRVLPLHNDGFGQVLVYTMKACEYFFDQIQELQERLKGLITITVPFPPDTNLICYAINPRNNKNLALMNHFSRKIFAHLKINQRQPLQAHNFFGSFTSLVKNKLDETQAQRILDDLGIDPATFCHVVEDRVRQADHIYVIRHTLMNPWLLAKEDDKNYIDRYCDYLTQIIHEELGKAIKRK